MFNFGGVGIRQPRVIYALAIAWCVAASDPALAAKADRIQDGYVGCLTDEALDEFIGAAIDKNQRHMDALYGSGQCFYIGGLEFDYVDAGFMTSEIRVYVPGAGSIVVLTPTEGTRE